MGDYRCVQEQLRLGGSEGSEVTCASVDVSGYEVVKFVPYVGVSGGTGIGGTLSYETAPIDDERYYRPLGDCSLQEGLCTVSVFLADDGDGGFEQFVRWKVKFTEVANDVTFDLDMMGYAKKR